MHDPLFGSQGARLEHGALTCAVAGLGFYLVANSVYQATFGRAPNAASEKGGCHDW